MSIKGRTLVTWQRTQLRILKAAVFAECGFSRSKYQNRTARYEYSYDCETCDDCPDFAWGVRRQRVPNQSPQSSTFLHKLTERGRGNRSDSDGSTAGIATGSDARPLCEGSRDAARTLRTRRESRDEPPGDYWGRCPSSWIASPNALTPNARKCASRSLNASPGAVKATGIEHCAMPLV
jgi:hypothetical protein